MNQNTLDLLVKSTLETVWAIGTSITASAVLIIFQYVNEPFYFKYPLKTKNTEWLTSGKQKLADKLLLT